jgi:predicted NBD/HSP70 family sugar kinase
MSAAPSQHQRHRLLLIATLRRVGTASRAEVARLTGLSRTTISKLVSELQAEGLVSERADREQPRAPTGGRPGVLLALTKSAGVVLGIDFGHTHVRVALADLSSSVLAEQQAELDVDRSAVEALDTAAELVERVLADANAARAAIVGTAMGLPGPIDRATGVVGSSVILPGWAGLRPAAELQARLGIPVELENDANLGALGELTYGAAHGVENLLYVKVASGIGAGLVLGGRLYRGHSGIAGELGHVLVEPQGPICRCGNRGCLETLAAAGPLLELLRPTFGKAFGAHELIEQSGTGDPACRRVLTDGGRIIGQALANLCNVLNPERVVVGGELSSAALLEGLRESLNRYALPAASAAADVRAGMLGERAALLGALRLATGETEQQQAARLLAAA